MSGERSVNILTRIHEAIVSCHTNGQEIESVELNTNAMLAFKEAAGKKIIEGLLPWDVYAPFNDNKKMLFLGIEIKEVMSNINGITINKIKLIPRMDIGEFDYERHDKGMRIVQFMESYDVCEAILNYAIGWEDGADVEINNEGTYAILFKYKRGIHWFHVPKRIVDNDLKGKVKLGEKRS